MNFKLLLKLLVISNLALWFVIGFMALCVGILLWEFFKAIFKYIFKSKKRKL